MMQWLLACLKKYLRCSKMNRAPRLSDLSIDGKRVIEMLIMKYGMTKDNAMKLVTDGGAALAVALISIVKGKK